MDKELFYFFQKWKQYRIENLVIINNLTNDTCKFLFT